MMIGEFAEISRSVSEVTLTERGLFHKGQVPEDLEDVGLDMEVVHEVQVVNARGEVLVIHFDVPQAKNVDEVDTPYQNKILKDADPNNNQMKSGVFQAQHKTKGDSIRPLMEVSVDNASANS